MSVADAVAALPGGGDFAALWNQVNGDPGSINDLADKLTSAASKAESSARAVSKSAAEVGDAWHGPAATAFAGYMHRFGAAASSVHAAMDKAGTAIDQAATAVEAAKAELTAIGSRVLDRAQQLAPLKAQAETQSLYDAAVTQAVQEACGEAKPVVDALVSHLEQTASAVHAAVSSGGFVAMSPTDAGTYLPARGKPIQWNPIPHGLDPGRSTAPQSSSGTGPSGSSTGAAPTTSGPESSGGPPSAPPTGNVKQWIDQATALLIKSGVPASKISANDINIIIEHESSGDPHAVNGWDSNAAAGTPSKGLMQTIDSTFSANALPGHTDIWNPVDNIVAGVRYALSRYGSLDNVPGVRAVHAGQAYVGY